MNSPFSRERDPCGQPVTVLHVPRWAKALAYALAKVAELRVSSQDYVEVSWHSIVHCLTHHHRTTQTLALDWRTHLPSQGIRERPWQRDVEPWDNWGARVARVVGRGRRILLVSLQRPRAHDDRADGGEGARGPGPVGDDSEGDPRAHLVDR